MSQEIDCIVQLSYDGERLRFSPLPTSTASRAVVDERGHILVLAEISPEPVRIAFETQQRNLKFQGLAAWWFDAEPEQKSYLSRGPIAGTPFSVQLEQNVIVLTDDHRGKGGRYGYEFELEYQGALVYVDPEIENRGESGGSPV